jgi:DnaD/phage-associated family protein
MAKMPWLKLYTEIRTDPKMQALSDLEFRTWINMMCLSAESKVRGVICIDTGLAYPVEGIARALYIGTDELTSCLNTFKKLRMIDVDQDGIITLTNFIIRQYDKPSDMPEEVAKRARKHQAKKGNAEIPPLKHQSNAKITLIKREENALEEDREKEGDIEKELDTNTIIITAREEIELPSSESWDIVPEKEQSVLDLEDIDPKIEENVHKDIGTEAVNWAQKKWGRPITSGEVEVIIAWCDDFLALGSPEPDAVVIEALKQCDAAGPEKRNQKYLTGILTKWHAAGILTVDHVLTREAEHKSQKEHKPGHKRPDNKASPSKYEKFYL